MLIKLYYSSMLYLVKLQAENDFTMYILLCHLDRRSLIMEQLWRCRLFQTFNMDCE